MCSSSHAFCDWASRSWTAVNEKRSARIFYQLLVTLILGDDLLQYLLNMLQLHVCHCQRIGDHLCFRAYRQFLCHTACFTQMHNGLRNGVDHFVGTLHISADTVHVHVHTLKRKLEPNVHCSKHKRLSRILSEDKTHDMKSQR